MLRLPDKLMPLVHLGSLLNFGGCAATGECSGGVGRELNHGFILVIQADTETFGVAVDALFGAEEIVVKPISARLRLFSGAAILGDGSVIPIIDPRGIARSIGTSETRKSVDANFTHGAVAA